MKNTKPNATYIARRLKEIADVAIEICYNKYDPNNENTQKIYDVSEKMDVPVNVWLSKRYTSLLLEMGLPAFVGYDEKEARLKVSIIEDITVLKSQCEAVKSLPLQTREQAAKLNSRKLQTAMNQWKDSQDTLNDMLQDLGKQFDELTGTIQNAMKDANDTRDRSATHQELLDKTKYKTSTTSLLVQCTASIGIFIGLLAVGVAAVAYGSLIVLNINQMLDTPIASLIELINTTTVAALVVAAVTVLGSGSAQWATNIVETERAETAKQKYSEAMENMQLDDKQVVLDSLADTLLDFETSLKTAVSAMNAVINV